MSRDRFTASQIATLRAEFAKIHTVNPDRLSDVHAIFAACGPVAVAQLSTAGIPFVSALAVTYQIRQKASR